jgi:hypothetical protein
MAFAWLLHDEEGKRIMHGRNGRERRLPELPDIHVDGLCEETHRLRVQRVLLALSHVHTI